MFLKVNYQHWSLWITNCVLIVWVFLPSVWYFIVEQMICWVVEYPIILPWETLGLLLQYASCHCPFSIAAWSVLQHLAELEQKVEPCICHNLSCCFSQQSHHCSFPLTAMHTRAITLPPPCQTDNAFYRELFFSVATIK